MIPQDKHVGPGRANSNRQAVLYLADQRDTAVAELRPWVGAHVSTAVFRTIKDAKVVDLVKTRLSDKEWCDVYFGNPNEEKVELAVWSRIGEAYSKPVTLEDEPLDYLPTQILAELFRQIGFDGIKYASSVGEGHNVVLFDLMSAKLVECKVVKIAALKFEIKHEGPFLP